MKTATQIPGKPRKHLRRASLTVIAVVALLRPYIFSIAGTDTTFSLNNKTRYYLHATINNETFVYIAPNRSVSVDVVAPISVAARVRYSPGQGVKGTGERTVEITTERTSSEQSATCTSEHGSSCTTDPEVTVTVTPGYWNVVETDLTAE